jgi:hypothetical protein
MVASQHVESGAVPSYVVWDQLLGLHLTPCGKVVVIHSGTGFTSFYQLVVQAVEHLGPTRPTARPNLQTVL